MINEYFAGSKTFLVGEYSVLFGGCSIVLITSPMFLLRLKKSRTSDLIGITDGSPAHLFWTANNFDNLSIEFCDPHSGSGGFGASSAQFVTLYKAYQSLTCQNFNINTFLMEYKKFSYIKNSIAPSGADCIAQYFNCHVFFDCKTNLIEKVYWKFPNLDFSIFKTSYKVSTHLHLQKLIPFDISDLRNLTLNVRESFLSLDENLLVNSVQSFFYSLKKKGLVADQIVEIIDKILRIEGVMAAKGCGALSADTIIVIFEKQRKDSIVQKVNSLGLPMIC